MPVYSVIDLRFRGFSKLTRVPCDPSFEHSQTSPRYRPYLSEDSANPIEPNFYISAKNSPVNVKTAILIFEYSNIRIVVPLELTNMYAKMSIFMT